MAERSDSLDLHQPPATPLPLFSAWYEEALRCDEIKYAAAMCLSSLDLDGFPDARTVLLKSYDATGFVFFTDVESRKGLSLAQCPQAALMFYWGPLDRQIRIRGEVATCPDSVSDECFKRRPRGSQITAWACKQSRPLADRDELRRRVEQYSQKFEGVDALPRPPHWQAYRLAPRSMEFWHARSNRLHDRLLYTRESQDSWHNVWLYP